MAVWKNTTCCSAADLKLRRCPPLKCITMKCKLRTVRLWNALMMKNYFICKVAAFPHAKRWNFWWKDFFGTPYENVRILPSPNEFLKNFYDVYKNSISIF